MSSTDLERKSILSNGNYLVRIAKVEELMGGSGFPYLNLTYDVLDNNGKPTGRQLWDRVSKSPKAAFMLDAFLDALQAPTSGKIKNSQLKGKRMWVTVGKSTYQGKMKDEVENYLTPLQAGVEGAEEEDFEPYNTWNVAGSAEEEDEEETSSSSFNPLDDEVDEDEETVGRIPEEMTEGEGEDIPF